MSDEEKDLSGEILNVTAEDGGSERLHMPPNKRLLLIVCTAAALIVIILAVIILSRAKKACLAPVKTFFSAVQDSDGEAYVKVLPPCMREKLGSDYAEYVEENMLRESLKELEEDYGGRIKVSFREEQRYALNDDETAKIADRLRERCGDIDIAKAYDIEVSYTIKGSRRSETKRREFTVCKAEGEWYMADRPNIIL